MRLLPMILGLIFPACGYEGIEGLPAATVMDMARIERPATPNTYLAAPLGASITPDRVTVFTGPPDRLYAAVKRVALAQERVFLHAAFDDRRQAQFVARSAAANYPDLIAAEVTREGGLILWSRSVYGRRDFGINEARVTAWIAAIEADLARN